RKNVTPTQATSDLEPVTAAAQRLLPAAIARRLSGAVLSVVPLHEAIVGSTRPIVLVLFCATSLVLLIACANVASLLLVRSVNRLKELALRRTLGAGRIRLVRQLLTEGVLLSCFGGLAGILVAVAVVRLVRAFLPASLPLAGSFHLQGFLVLIALGVSIISGILFSLAPAVLSWRIPLNVSLNAETARVTTGIRGDRLRSVFVASEIALAFVLLVLAGLLVRSLQRLVAVNPGFEPRQALTVQVTLTESRYPLDSQRRSFFEQLLEKIDALPGVDCAGGTTDLPFYYGFSTRSDVILQRSGGPGPEPIPSIPVSAVTPDYFRAMGIPLIAGRFFSPDDRDPAAPVAIVNQWFAEQFLRGTRSIGTHLRLQSDQGKRSRELTVVGIVGNTRSSGLDAPIEPELTLPFLAFPDSALTLAVRARNDPQRLIPLIRDTVRQLDRDQPIYHAATMQERVDAANSPHHFDAWLLGIFSALALGLAAVGLYGVISYTVANRAREIGIRMALGARQADIVLIILGRGMRLALAGITIGMAVSAALAGLLRGLVFGIAPTDPVTYTAAAAFLTAVAVAACCVPAVRASSFDPTEALRSE
ncbi:MAG: FtsX-like permease family protein, partial [Acidobacteriaceae bacterium]|nr:FtsX-like permease family protein [Acidobacteriaceae bacterium]